MKKAIFSTTMVFVLLLSIFSCSSDDDGGEQASNCRTCEIDIILASVSTQYCDNGDGTVTATTDGQSETIELEEGIDFEGFIAAQELLLATCN